eukprot:TRINITY_DN14054_c0_g1_i3.p1 TRINITY_DN14054_c0_g1~~TRINITY_DN14054_c0_g1_i3.p1  ORF type:complete len:232 (+),score=41.77 TRINITY_DN14054_c0_g1_i3:67-762(+)
MGNAVARFCPRRLRGQPEASEPLYDTASSSSLLTSNVRVPTNHVQLAVSPIGPGAYHSSVLINGEEYSFSDGGISCAPGLASHSQMQQQNQAGGKQEPMIIDFGMSLYAGSELRAQVEQHFLTGTYDLLRKNCNSFSDCALFFLVHKRMPKKYRSMEQLGSAFSGILKSTSQYTPNPKAADFDLEKLIKTIDPEKVWKTPGNATGGNTVTSAEAMRDARLAALSRGTGNAV